MDIQLADLSFLYPGVNEVTNNLARAVNMVWTSTPPTPPPVLSAPCMLFLILLVRNVFDMGRQRMYPIHLTPKYNLISYISEIENLLLQPTYNFTVKIREGLRALPLLPCFKTGKGTQGVNFKKALNNKAMAKRTKRLLRKYIKKMEKSTHHAMRKGYAQRMFTSSPLSHDAHVSHKITQGSCGRPRSSMVVFFRQTRFAFCATWWDGANGPFN